MSHPRTEETRSDEGESASGRGGFWFLVLVGFCLVFGGCLCSLTVYVNRLARADNRKV